MFITGKTHPASARSDPRPGLDDLVVLSSIMKLVISFSLNYVKENIHHYSPF